MEKIGQMKESENMNNWRRVTAILLAAVTVSSTMNGIPMNKMEVLAADNKIELAEQNKESAVAVVNSMEEMAAQNSELNLKIEC